MTWEIYFVFGLLGLSIYSFIHEQISPDLTALMVLGILIFVSMITGVNTLPSLEATLGVFAHPAPITIAGMFIVSTALEKTGVIESITQHLGRLSKLSYKRFLFVMILGVAAASAFVNNTPVVIVLMPVILTLAKSMNIASSKLLIPLSYASILGGTCTLIGTSTNLLASGILTESGYEPIGMFELASIGLPLVFAGTIFLVLFGNRLLPHRETLTAILSEDERKEFMTEVFVRPNSDFIGSNANDSGLAKHRSIRLIEIIRSGVVLKGKLNEIELREGDRLLLACRPTQVDGNANSFQLPEEFENSLGIISSNEGLVIEGIVAPHAQFIGKTLEEVNFRQQFRMVLMAIHRKGVNLRDSLNELRLQEGDTLLLMGSMDAVENLESSDQIIILDRVHKQTKPPSLFKQSVAVLTILGIVFLASFNVIPIVAAVIFGVSVLLISRCLEPSEAYQSVHWPILAIIFGMLALGQAMTSTGASNLIAEGIANCVFTFAPIDLQPIILLAVVYLITSAFTEFLSNNAAVALMIPIAISLAINLGLDPRPFVIATCIASSASFATPIGYQTNTYVYGAGGYRFTDFTKIGLPLNAICFVIATIFIPMIWEF
ncbi:MAG: SLC13 family permease [Opitutae bacterium]|nr:SLC13 family permease [Opitutae bacterium]